MTQVSIDQAMVTAVEHHQAGRFAQAEQVYRQVLAVAPNHPDALHLLGVVAFSTGRIEPAIELISRAIAIQPGVPDFHYNLGVAQMMGQRTMDAAESFRRAVGLNPRMFTAHSNLAVALMTLGRYEESIAASRAALAIQPKHAESWNNLGTALKESGRHDDAFDAFERAVSANPQLTEALMNLGNSLLRAGRSAEAVAMHRRAVALGPDSPDTLHNLATSLFDELEYEQSVEMSQRAIKLRPGFREAWCTLANSYYRMARLDDAIAAARKAIELWPDSPFPRFNLSLMLLARGQFQEGWRMHESRWAAHAERKPPPKFPQPLWDGSDLNGRTILLYSEQGFGDTIQFVRYVPMVRAKGGKIILGCQAELERLLQQVEGVERVVAEIEPTLRFDVRCPLMTLPMIFGTNLGNIPASQSYLKADPNLADRWRGRIPDDPKRLKVGIAWAGRPTHDNDRNRSISLSQLAPLAQAGDVWCCSLQKGDAANQAAAAPAGLQIADFSGDMQDFADLAAIIANLDLVISVDTAPAHLAAAMGKPTWLLLPYAPDWRWLRDREDSPWYPTMRLFRQPRLRDWQTPIERVATALRERAAGARPH